MFKKTEIAIGCCMVVVCGVSGMDQQKDFLKSKQIIRRHSEPSTLHPSTKVEVDIDRSKSAPLVSKIINIDEINKQYSYLPYENRLSILEYQIRDKYSIPHQECTTATEEKKLIDMLFIEGNSAIGRKDISTSECILDLLSNPADMFHFSSRYESDKFVSKQEYESRLNEICSYSKQKADSLDWLIEISSSEDDSGDF